MNSPGIITALQPQKAHPDRVSLFVDDQFICGMSRELAFQLRLKVGISVTSEDLERWIFESAKESAIQTALKYIASRPRTRQQVLLYMKRKEIEEDLALEAVSYLESRGYLNDEQFAEDFVRSRVQFKPRGKKIVKWELKQRGISEETIELAMTNYEDEVEAAFRLTTRKFNIHRDHNLQTKRELELKVGRFLSRKGFSGTTIRSVLKRLNEMPFLDNDCT